MFGFQTFKEPGDGATITEQHAKWCCLAGQGDKPWVIPNGWVANRNARRNLPPGIGTERFRTWASVKISLLKISSGEYRTAATENSHLSEHYTPQSAQYPHHRRTPPSYGFNSSNSKNHRWYLTIVTQPHRSCKHWYSFGWKPDDGQNRPKHVVFLIIL